MKKRVSKSINVKSLSRVVTAVVLLGAGALVVLTVLFFMKTLSDVAQAQKADTTRSARMEAIHGDLLDKLLKFHEDRANTEPFNVTAHGNPFIPMPARVVEVAPPPAPTPVPPTDGLTPPPATPDAPTASVQ